LVKWFGGIPLKKSFKIGDEKTVAILQWQMFMQQ
jgi:hypothetical protein